MNKHTLILDQLVLFMSGTAKKEEKTIKARFLYK